MVIYYNWFYAISFFFIVYIVWIRVCLKGDGRKSLNTDVFEFQYFKKVSVSKGIRICPGTQNVFHTAPPQEREHYWKFS